MDWKDILRRVREYAVEAGKAGESVAAEATEAHELAQDAINLQRAGRVEEALESGRAAEQAFQRLTSRLKAPPTERYTDIERALAHSSTEGILAEDAARQVAARELLATTAARRGVLPKSPSTGKAAWYRRTYPR